MANSYSCGNREFEKATGTPLPGSSQFALTLPGLGVLCLRIGTCLAAPRDARHLSTWISERDLVKLVCVGLEVGDLHFEVVYGISNNDRAWWDNRRAYELGYQSQDNAETYAAEILSLEKPEDVDDVAHQFQGGVFTSAGFNGDVQKID